MKENLGCCGYRCGLCPAYKDNISNEEDRQKVSDGWFTYYGFRIPVDEVYCDGCKAEDCQNPRRIDPECEVRACALERGLPNCAPCSDFMCEKLSKKVLDIEKVVKKAGGSISDEDFERFVRPYDSATVLADLRRQLEKSE